MRIRLVACSCLLVAVSAGSVKTLAASPDCARWIRDYQQGLAKRASLAKKHVVHAARALHVPRPRLVHASTPVHRLRPAKLSPQEMLKRFRVLCGDDLPDEPLPVSFVPTSLDTMLLPPVPFVESGPLLTEAGLPVSFTPTPAVVTDSGTPVTNPITDSGVLRPVFTGSVPGSGFPGTPIVTPPVTNVPVVEAPVPEPGSLLLLGTGLLGALPLLKRRLR